MKKNQSAVEHIIYEMFGNGNLSKYESLIDIDVKIQNPPSVQEIFPPYLSGRKNAKKIDQEYQKAFRIKQIEICDLVCDHDKILVRWSFEAIHKENFFSIKASQRHFGLTGQTIYRFNKEDKVREVWQAWDLLGLFRQITAVEINCMSDKLRQQTASLSEKERECLKYLLEGKTAKESAYLMKRSFRTIEYYFENIKNKLNCFSKRELIAIAHQLSQANEL